jgi:hypothetical protein
MRLFASSVVDASAARTPHEGHLAEVAGLQPIENVAPLGAPPTHEVRFGDEDGARPLKAASAALEAIEFRRRPIGRSRASHVAATRPLGEEPARALIPDGAP